jgi:hypothetical protein
MSPNQINREHGKPVWKCWHCRAESGLHWWNGLSVAVCDNKECSDACTQFINDEAEREQAYQDYVRETYGGDFE